MAILPTDIQILFTNYDIIAYFLNLASCSEHFISIKHRILTTFNINNKNQFERLYAFNIIVVYKEVQCIRKDIPFLHQILVYNYTSFLANQLARSPGQVKLDSDK
jgi:hypothetical protein